MERTEQVGGQRRYGRQGRFDDSTAVAAALLWLLVMLMLGSISGVPMVTAMTRGMAGSILVYVLVSVMLYFTLHAAARNARRTKRSRK